MKHGGDLLSYQHKFEGQIIDFSSNINPLGYPSGLKQVIIDNFDKLIEYPDINYRSLKKIVAAYLGCDDDNVIVGNGAVDIIDNISGGFDRIVVPVPCFGEYIDRPKLHNKQVIMLPMLEDFIIDVIKIEQTLISGDLLILGNPNNPTGKRIDKEVLIALHSLVIERCAFLLIDEAFFEFCKFDYDSIELFRHSEAVCIIRAATKFFALPGIRLGYGFTSKTMTIKYNKKAIPWNINTFADTAAANILRDNEFISRSKEYIRKQRSFMMTELKKIKEIHSYDTHCNFILIKLLKGSEEDIFEFLLSKGIMIRKASSFEMLDTSYIRIAIKSENENMKLIGCLEEYFLKEF